MYLSYDAQAFEEFICLITQSLLFESDDVEMPGMPIREDWSVDALRERRSGECLVVPFGNPFSRIYGFIQFTKLRSSQCSLKIRYPVIPSQVHLFVLPWGRVFVVKWSHNPVASKSFASIGDFSQVG